jgi:hypothetical protein
MNRLYEMRDRRLCSAKRSSLRRSGDEPFIETAQSGPVCATQAQFLIFFKYSTHTTENRYKGFSEKPEFQPAAQATA